jgi:predicted O-methyltransferase YrrM
MTAEPRESWTIVDDYLARTLFEHDPALSGVLTASVEAGMPQIHVSPLQGRLLQVLAATLGVRRILEIGTLAGYSTICLARGMAPGGRLVTLEYEPAHAEVARGCIGRAGLSGLVDLRVGRAIDLLPALEREGPFDLTFIDADKSSSPEYVRWAIRLSRPGSLIILDNVVRDGKVVDESTTDANVRGIRDALAIMGSHEGLTSTALQTVGCKGHDGFAIARVN